MIGKKWQGVWSQNKSQAASMSSSLKKKMGRVFLCSWGVMEVVFFF